MDRFTVIDGGKPKITREAYEQAVCPMCDGSHFIESVLSPMYHENKIVAGTPTYICVHCLAEGAIVRIAF